jgi:hypothetical protein
MSIEDNEIKDYLYKIIKYFDNSNLHIITLLWIKLKYRKSLGSSQKKRITQCSQIIGFCHISYTFPSKIGKRIHNRERTSAKREMSEGKSQRMDESVFCMMTCSLFPWYLHYACVFKSLIITSRQDGTMRNVSCTASFFSKSWNIFNHFYCVRLCYTFLDFCY